MRDFFSTTSSPTPRTGENNNDGTSGNVGWNRGWEGETDDPPINRPRRRMIKNAIAPLFVSRGTPMLLMGDELGRTQHGNNNTCCHDSPVNWLDWSLRGSQEGIFRFARKCVAFRPARPVLRGQGHFQNRDYAGSGLPDISWHGTRAWCADWSDTSRVISRLRPS